MNFAVMVKLEGYTGEISAILAEVRVHASYHAEFLHKFELSVVFFVQIDSLRTTGRPIPGGPVPSSLPAVSAATNCLSGLHSKLSSLDAKLDALPVDASTRPLRYAALWPVMRCPSSETTNFPFLSRMPRRKAQLARVERTVALIDSCMGALKGCGAGAAENDVMAIFVALAPTTA